MKVKKLKILVAFVLVLQLVIFSPMNAPKITYAESNTLREALIHEYTQNTWAYSSLAKSPNGDLYLSHMKNYNEISVKKLGNGSWNEITKVTTSATGDTGFYGGADIAVSGDNLVHIAFAYTKGDGLTSVRGVKYGVYQNSSWSFQTIEGLTDPYGWKNTRNQKIAIDTNGKAHIVYEYSDANDPRKYEIRYATNQSGTWSIKTLASGASAIDEVHEPQIEVDQNNRIHITFVKEDNQNDYYGNLYYIHKKTSDTEFSPAEKIVDAIADQKDYYYTPFIVDSLGKVHFSFYEGNIWAEDYMNETFITYYQTNQMGDWNREVVYSDKGKFSYPVKVQIANSKPVISMYSESKDWPPSELGFFALMKDKGVWMKGTKVVSPSLIDRTPSELTYAIDSVGNHVLVMLDNGLRKISYLTGSNEDFGLITMPPISSNADLNDLVVSAGGSMNPGFSSGVTNYTTNVGNAVQSIQVMPSVADSNSTLKINGVDANSGVMSHPISLHVGENVIQVVVTAQDGTPKTYTLTVYRAPSNNANLANLTVNAGSLTPVFNPSVKNYNVRVPLGTEQIQFTPTVADMNATVVVSGNSLASGQQSSPVRLNPGVNQIPVIVTAQDGTSATYTVAVTRNQPPATTDITYTVDENVQTGTSVGLVQVNDPDRDALNYTILSGNTNGAFAVNPTTGEIKVENGSLLDYESTKSFSLAVQVTDGIDQATANVTINVRDINDNHPIAHGFTNAINENSANGTLVGQVTATDVDAGSQFTYNITAGNSEGAFAIDTTSGEITVANSSKLDYEMIKRFPLTVQVNDGLNTADTSVIIDLRNENDNIPILNDAVFRVDENAAIGTVVGVISGMDADGDLLQYQIIGGNEAGAFTIHPVTGEIVVTNSSLLDFETITTYSLLVQASDEIGPVTLSPYALITSLFANSPIDSDIATITINLNDLNDNRPVSQGFSATMDENSANGTTVGTVTATDADAGSQFTYSITAGNSEGAFAIDATSGEVTVTDSSKLDYETIKNFTLTVQVSDGSNTEDTTVSVELSNLNDNPPLMDDDVFNIEENATNGTLVGSVTGSDADGDSLSYGIISGNEQGAFKLDSTSGEISVADGSKLDFEKKSSYELKVQVSDRTETDIATITIHLIDQNDNHPVPQGFTANVDENLVNGTVIGTVTATDADAGSHFTYSLTAGNEQGAFAIDAASGEVTVADSSKLDYETIKSFTLTVQVSDGTHTATTTVKIHLNNVNDNLPVAESATLALEENSVNGTKVGTVIASDADGEPLSYHIVSGNEAGAFAMDMATGKIMVADSSKLDYENNQTYTLTVRVGDGKNTADANIMVNIKNVNDNTPIAESATFNIQENAANDTVVGKVVANDADGDPLRYQILSGNETGAFTIDEATGKIAVADGSKLDYEEMKSFTLTVQVSDGVKMTDTSVIIQVSNVNDNTPVAESAKFTINENLETGTEVGSVSASDADGNPLGFSIVSGNETGAFTIDATTGKITVADGSQLDYEKIKSFPLTIHVSDQANTTDTQVTIDLNNLNDNTPTAETGTFTIDENSENGMAVGKIKASDADGDSLSYRILSGKETGAFKIDAATGKLTVAEKGKLDYEAIQSFTLTVQVSDGSKTTDSIVTINVNNLNDNKPVVKDAVFTIDENTSTGTEVGTVIATDTDGDALSYQVVSGNETGAFTIDTTTGKITVADGSQLDFEKVKNFKLTVQASDPAHSVHSQVKIDLKNVNDNTPVAEDATFSVDEKAANGTVIGTVTASDADEDEIQYSITSGNESGVFAVNKKTGEITLATAALLDAATKALHNLSIEASDGEKTAALTVNVQVLSSDVTLSQLSNSKGKLNPEFKPGTTQYRINVGESTESIKFTPNVTNSNATLKINGKHLKSGNESEAVSLDVGENIIAIEVTAQNGQKATYTILVMRQKMSVTTAPVKSGTTVTITDQQVNLLDQAGTLVVELKKNLEDVESIQFSAQQLKTLIERQAKVKVKKDDVELLIPAANFTAGEDLVISLEQVDRNPVKLPSTDLAAGAIYDFTIKLGGKIISQFDYDIELAFPVDHLNVAHPEELKVFYWNPDKKEWELVGGTYENGKIKAMTNHFSTYGVFHPNQLADSQANLPETATNTYNWIFTGILVLLFGGAMILGQRLRFLDKN
ncbi:cadherin domain-containing protein [Neobacillus sp. K501]